MVDYACVLVKCINYQNVMCLQVIYFLQDLARFLQKPYFLQVFFLQEMSNCFSRAQLLGQCFSSSGSRRSLLQDEDHSGSRPHSFTGLCQLHSGTFPHRFRSSPELASSWGSRQDVIMRLLCSFLSCWNLETTFCNFFLNFLRKLSYVVFLWYGNIWVLCQIAPNMFPTTFRVYCCQVPSVSKSCHFLRKSD